MYTTDDVLERGIILISHGKSSIKMKNEIFVKNYGCKPNIVTFLWSILMTNSSLKDEKLKHLFWTLSFLKTYELEFSLAFKFNVDRKTFRKHVLAVMVGIVDLRDKVVRNVHSLNNNINVFVYDLILLKLMCNVL